MGLAASIDYTNWKGERRWRTIVPIRVEFTATKWHPQPQWMLEAADLEDVGPDGYPRDKFFAMKDIHGFAEGPGRSSAKREPSYAFTVGKDE